jgi:hypothetical protein
MTITADLLLALTSGPQWPPQSICYPLLWIEHPLLTNRRDLGPHHLSPYNTTELNPRPLHPIPESSHHILEPAHSTPLINNLSKQIISLPHLRAKPCLHTLNNRGLRLLSLLALSIPVPTFRDILVNLAPTLGTHRVRSSSMRGVTLIIICCWPL